MTDTSQDDTLPLSRILAKRPGFFRTVERGGDLAQVYDQSSLPYLIEEFVASAAVNIAVTATSPATLHLQELPPTLRPRVVVVDEGGAVMKQVAAILEPLAAEFHLDFTQSGRVSASLQTPPAVLVALGPFVPTLYDFLLGVQYRLQVDVDLSLMQEALRIFREHARDSESRARLAVLQGAFGSYKPVKIASLALQSGATDEQLERFKWFIEDVTYQHVSRDAGLLGVPEDGDRAVQLIARGFATLAKKPLFKPIVTIGSKLIAKATTVDVDAENLISALLPKRYLPPIIPLSSAYARAEALWRSQREPYRETDLTIAAIGPGWRDAADEAQPGVIDFLRTYPGTL